MQSEQAFDNVGAELLHRTFSTSSGVVVVSTFDITQIQQLSVNQFLELSVHVCLKLSG